MNSGLGGMWLIILIFGLAAIVILHSVVLAVMGLIAGVVMTLVLGELRS